MDLAPPCLRSAGKNRRRGSRRTAVRGDAPRSRHGSPAGRGEGTRQPRASGGVRSPGEGRRGSLGQTLCGGRAGQGQGPAGRPDLDRCGRREEPPGQCPQGARLRGRVRRTGCGRDGSADLCHRRAGCDRGRACDRALHPRPQGHTAPRRRCICPEQDGSSDCGAATGGDEDGNGFQYPVSRGGDPLCGGLAARAHDERRRLTMANKLADWLEALTDPDDATREEAAQALIKLAAPAATDALIEALQDDYWSVRMHAGHALAKIGGPRVIEALIPMLGDTIKECRDGAVEDFVTICTPGVERLIAALRDGRWRVREGAAKALGLLKDKRAVDPLIAALRDRDGSVRTIAAEALGRIGDPKATKGLMALFKDTSKLVRVAATIALTQIGEPTVAPLIEGLKDENFQVRLHSVQALGGITSDYPTGRSWLRDSRPVPPLIALLKDKDRAVREDAAIALGMIGDPSAVPALIEAMQDGAVRVRAIMALGMIADPRSVEPLIRVLEGVGINLKGTPMPGCIVSEEWFIREQAALALGHINDLRSVPALCQALKDTRLREKASQALIELGPQIIDMLVDFINDPEASKVEQLSENVMSFASNRLDAAASLRALVMDILMQLGWTPPEEGQEGAPDKTTAEGAKG